MDINNKKSLVIVGGIIIAIILIFLVITVGLQQFLGARNVPALSEEIVGGQLITSPLQPGTHRLEFRAKTANGKEVVDTVEISVDNDPYSNTDTIIDNSDDDPYAV